MDSFVHIEAILYYIQTRGRIYVLFNRNNWKNI